MKYVKNSYFPIVCGGIIILALGLFIGLSVNKKDVYSKVDMVANNSVTSNNEVKITEETNEEQIAKENIVEQNTDKQVINDKEYEAKQDSDKNTSIIKEENENTNKEESYSSNDEIVINSLENSLTKINDGNKNDSSFADSAKGVFVSIVDFLFYDGEINGVSFDELTDSGKQKVLEIASKEDGAIESKIPGYKETISSTASKAFNKASEIIKSGANNLNNFAKEKLGDENYQSIIDAKDELVYYTKNALNFLGDVGGKVFNSVKDKLDSWYQDFKNN